MGLDDMDEFQFSRQKSIPHNNTHSKHVPIMSSLTKSNTEQLNNSPFHSSSLSSSSPSHSSHSFSSHSSSSSVLSDSQLLFSSDFVTGPSSPKSYLRSDSLNASTPKSYRNCDTFKIISNGDLQSCQKVSKKICSSPSSTSDTSSLHSTSSPSHLVTISNTSFPITKSSTPSIDSDMGKEIATDKEITTDNHTQIKITPNSHVDKAIATDAHGHKDIATDSHMDKAIGTDKEITTDNHTQIKITPNSHVDKAITTETHIPVNKEIATDSHIDKEIGTDKEITTDNHTQIKITPNSHVDKAITTETHIPVNKEIATDSHIGKEITSELHTGKAITTETHNHKLSLVRASPRLLKLMEGQTEPGDSGNSTEPPNWLDRKLFNRGREFYNRYLFCLSFSDLLSLVLMMCMENSLKPLIYTGRSDTRYKALRRYMSTFLHLITWYKGDVWDPEDTAHKDIISVRRTHARIASNINNKDYEKVLATSVKDKGHEEPNKPLYPSISADFGAATDIALPEVKSPMFISQFDMSLTQYAFMGLILAHPEKLGAGSATEEDFAGLLHFWRGLGWLLGIEDQFNFCNGTVEEVRSLSLEVERQFGIPGLAKAGWDYEHMISVLIEGMGSVLHILSYPSMLCYLAYTINIPIPNVIKNISFQHKIRYWVFRFVFGFIHIVPWCLTHLNRDLTNLMNSISTNGKLKISAYRKEQIDAIPDSPQHKTCPFP